MPTPRPPGVRRADDNEEQIVQHVTSLYALGPGNPLDPRASLRSHALTPLSQIWARLCSPKPRIQATVRRNLFSQLFGMALMRHPWRMEKYGDYMEVSKEGIKTILQKLDKLLCKFFPGIIVFDICFNKGLISGGIESIYNFLLLLFWSYLLSIPFELLIPTKINHMMDEFKKAIIEVKKIDKSSINWTKEKDEYYDDINYDFKIKYVFLKVIMFLICYLIRKPILVQIPSLLSWISPNIINVIISYIVSGILGIPVGHICIMWSKRHMKKTLGRMIKEEKI
jgi:hypothetical protein